jgi:hypothetical protein
MLPFDKCSFDMIMLHDVLEHLHDSPRDLLNDLFELEIEWTTRIDTMWLEICPVRIGEIPQGLGTPDQYVLVTEDGEPTVRVDAYASSEESYTFRDAIKWRDFIVIGWGHGVYLIDLHSHHVSGH